MKELNVAIVTPNDIGKYSETFIQNHVDYLKFNKFVIYGGPVPHNCNGVSKLSFLNKLKFRLHRLCRTAKSKDRRFYDKELLKQHLIANKIDVVLAEYVLTASNICDVCKELSIPIVATGLGYELSVNKVLIDNRAKYIEFLHYCSAVVIVSKSMSKILLELGCAENKIIHSPAGASTYFMELNPDYSSRQIIAVGRFVEKKSPHSTIMAFNKVLEIHPESRLVFAGDGPLLMVCKDLVDILGIQDKVIFAGIISQEEQRRLLQESSVFVQHSKVAPNGDSEGTPVAIVEASSAGLPIVSTRHAGIIDVVVNGESGFLVEEGDVNAMAEKISILLSNPVLLEKMGRKGKEYISANFTLDQHIEKIEESLVRAVGSM